MSSESRFLISAWKQKLTFCRWRPLAFWQQVCENLGMKTTVELPARLWKQAQAVAARRGQRLPELVADVLHQALPRQESKTRKTALRRSKKSLPQLAPRAKAWLRNWKKWSTEISAKVKTSE